MQDSRIDISVTKVVTLALWAWVGFVLVAAWVAWVIGLGSLWEMLGFTACASSAVAATAQIRCYSCALSAVVKGRQGLDRQEAASLHSLR